jgi:hypothetical protein
MNENLNADQLIDEAIGQVPKELQGDLRDWLSRARKGQLLELSAEILQKADGLWDDFDNAAKKVERKLQE